MEIIPSKEKFSHIIDMVKEYKFPVKDGEMGLDVMEVSKDVVIISPDPIVAERSLTLTYIPGEIFAVYTELGADTHIPHIPKEDAVVGVDILLDEISTPNEVFSGDIKPRLDYFVQWANPGKGWVATNE